MKLTKYLLFACSALVLASCGNDDNWNTANDVTVQMANATMQTKENKNLFNVPLEVIGKANGPIRVTVDVTEVSENPAVENVNYIITSNTVVIPDNDSEVFIEIAPVNDDEINENRIFIVSIVDAEGAKVGEQNSTEITIRDDDSMPYEAIQGTWQYTFSEDGDNDAFTMTLEGVDDENILYDHVLYLSGWGKNNDMSAVVNFTADEETGEAIIEIPYGQILGKAEFGNLGECEVELFGYDGTYIYEEGSAIGTTAPKYKTIAFDPSEQFLLGVLYGGKVYLWYIMENMTMVR